MWRSPADSPSGCVGMWRSPADPPRKKAEGDCGGGGKGPGSSGCFVSGSSPPLSSPSWEAGTQSSEVPSGAAAERQAPLAGEAGGDEGGGGDGGNRTSGDGGGGGEGGGRREATNPEQGSLRVGVDSSAAIEDRPRATRGGGVTSAADGPRATRGGDATSASSGSLPAGDGATRAWCRGGEDPEDSSEGCFWEGVSGGGENATAARGEHAGLCERAIDSSGATGVLPEPKAPIAPSSTPPPMRRLEPPRPTAPDTPSALAADGGGGGEEPLKSSADGGDDAGREERWGVAVDPPPIASKPSGSAAPPSSRPMPSGAGTESIRRPGTEGGSSPRRGASPSSVAPRPASPANGLESRDGGVVSSTRPSPTPRGASTPSPPAPCLVSSASPRAPLRPFSPPSPNESGERNEQRDRPALRPEAGVAISRSNRPRPNLESDRGAGSEHSDGVRRAPNRRLPTCDGGVDASAAPARRGTEWRARRRGRQSREVHNAKRDTTCGEKRTHATDAKCCPEKDGPLRPHSSGPSPLPAPPPPTLPFAPRAPHSGPSRQSRPPFSNDPPRRGPRGRRAVASSRRERALQRMRDALEERAIRGDSMRPSAGDALTTRRALARARGLNEPTGPRGAGADRRAGPAMASVPRPETHPCIRALAPVGLQAPHRQCFAALEAYRLRMFLWAILSAVQTRARSRWSRRQSRPARERAGLPCRGPGRASAAARPAGSRESKEVSRDVRVSQRSPHEGARTPGDRERADHVRPHAGPAEARTRAGARRRERWRARGRGGREREGRGGRADGGREGEAATEGGRGWEEGRKVGGWAGARPPLVPAGRIRRGFKTCSCAGRGKADASLVPPLRFPSRAGARRALRVLHRIARALIIMNTEGRMTRSRARTAAARGETRACVGEERGDGKKGRAG